MLHMVVVCPCSVSVDDRVDVTSIYMIILLIRQQQQHLYLTHTSLYGLSDDFAAPCCWNRIYGNKKNFCL